MKIEKPLVAAQVLCLAKKPFLRAWPPEQPRDGGLGMFFTKVLCAHPAQVWDCPTLGFLEKQVSNAINLKEPQRQGAEREQSCWGLWLCRAGRASPGCHSPRDPRCDVPPPPPPPPPLTAQPLQSPGCCRPCHGGALRCQW